MPVDNPNGYPLLQPNSIYLSLRRVDGTIHDRVLYLYISDDGLYGYRAFIERNSAGHYFLNLGGSIGDRSTGTILLLLRFAVFRSEATAMDAMNRAIASFNQDLADGILAPQDEGAAMIAFLDVLHSLGMTLASGATLVQQLRTLAVAPQHIGVRPPNMVDAHPGLAGLA
ncbi:hypothetical protein CALVIDRAFT_172323 [Calocera viscosa TUFC12733]|uniref:Uncharacterized protein n=1 Tax=Calocera viscosa (strain TUFC12733) TaxID=1330018 RepID=A0A167LA40_CALVF|nr:hypothetical protein CALVIDRAFT_172323 [Calocera viscosa TUFC12733]